VGLCEQIGGGSGVSGLTYSSSGTFVRIKKRIAPAKREVPIINIFTGIASIIGIAVYFLFASKITR
jgi:hypothetical protein